MTPRCFYLLTPACECDASSSYLVFPATVNYDLEFQMEKMHWIRELYHSHRNKARTCLASISSHLDRPRTELRTQAVVLEDLCFLQRGSRQLLVSPDVLYPTYIFTTCPQESNDFLFLSNFLLSYKFSKRLPHLTVFVCQYSIKCLLR